MRVKKSPCEWSTFSGLSYFSRESHCFFMFPFLCYTELFRTFSDIFRYYLTPMKNPGNPRIKRSKNVTPINLKKFPGIVLNEDYYYIIITIIILLILLSSSLSWKHRSSKQLNSHQPHLPHKLKITGSKVW